MKNSTIDAGLTPEIVLETGKKLRKALLATLSKEEKLAGLTPQERLAGLAPEEVSELLEQIEAYLRIHPIKKSATKK